MPKVNGGRSAQNNSSIIKYRVASRCCLSKSIDPFTAGLDRRSLNPLGGVKVTMGCQNTTLRLSSRNASRSLPHAWTLDGLLPFGAMTVIPRGGVCCLGH